MGSGLISEAALDGAFTADGMAALLQRVADSVGAEGATLTFSHRSTQLGAITSAALLQYVAPYLDPNRPADPRPSRVNPTLGEGFRLDQDDFSAEELGRDPYYQEFLRPFGYGWHACALLAGGPGGDTVNLTLRRTSRQGMFEHEQLTTLAAHLPLIRATADITQMMGGLMGAGARADGDERRALYGFDARGCAYVVHEGRVACGVLTVRRGRLWPAGGLAQETQVSAVLERAGAQGRQASTILTAPDGAWWLLSVVPASLMAPPWMTPFLTWATLTPYEPSAAVKQARVEQLAALFGLSPAEARVAGLIGEAKTVTATARLLGASPGTVRNHLKAVFAKIGVGRQAELVAVLSRF